MCAVCSLQFAYHWRVSLTVGRLSPTCKASRKPDAHDGWDWDDSGKKQKRSHQTGGTSDSDSAALRARIRELEAEKGHVDSMLAWEQQQRQQSLDSLQNVVMQQQMLCLQQQQQHFPPLLQQWPQHSWWGHLPQGAWPQQQHYPQQLQGAWPQEQHYPNQGQHQPQSPSPSAGAAAPSLSAGAAPSPSEGGAPSPSASAAPAGGVAAKVDILEKLETKLDQMIQSCHQITEKVSSPRLPKDTAPAKGDAVVRPATKAMPAKLKALEEVKKKKPVSADGRAPWQSAVKPVAEKRKPRQKQVVIYTAGLRHLGLEDHKVHDRSDSKGMARKIEVGLQLPEGDLDAVVNCCPLFDPTVFPCSGENPFLQERWLEPENFHKLKRVFKELKYAADSSRMSSRDEIHVLTFCASGKHRSIGTASFLKYLIDKNNWNMEVKEIKHLHEMFWPDWLCHMSCDACQNARKKIEVHERLCAVYDSL